MLDKIKTLIVKKYLLGYLVQGYTQIKGYKTQIIAAIAVIVWAAARFGYVPPDQEKNLYEILGGAGTITLLQKLQRWQNIADEVGKATQEEANKKENTKS